MFNLNTYNFDFRQKCNIYFIFQICMKLYLINLNVTLTILLKMILFIYFFFLQNAKVTAHWHKGTTYMVKFEDYVITRDKQMDER